MIGIDELLQTVAALRQSDLDLWIRDQLVAPQREGEVLFFSESESARVRLICTLHYELEIDTQTLPVVLSLLDQLYDTRQKLLSMTAAIAVQDKAVQAKILKAIDAGAGRQEPEED